MSTGAPRIHLYVHGRGRGHGTRARAIAERLQTSGADVRVFAGAGAESAFDGSAGCTPVQSLVPGMGLSTLGRLRTRVKDAMAETMEDRPDVVISDGDMPGTVAARLAGVPAVAVGHGLVFSHAMRPPDLPRGPWLREAAKARAASVGTHRQVAVNFIPLEARVETATIARPVLRDALANQLGSRPTPGEDVVCYFRDDNGDTILGALVQLGVTPLLFGPRDPGITGVSWRAPDAESFAHALLGARAVVSSAGSQLISECVALGLSQFAVFAPGDDEQLLNVAMLRDAGLGDGCALEEATRDRLEGFVTGLAGEPSPAPDPWGPDAADAVCEAVQQLLS